MQAKQLIDGEFVEGQGQKLSSVDPASGNEIIQIAEASVEQT